MVTVLWTVKQERKMRVQSGLLISFNEELRETSWDRADFSFREKEQAWDKQCTQAKTSERRTCRGGLLRAEKLKSFVGL